MTQNQYNQEEIDEEFNALIERTRCVGLVSVADHFGKAEGMSRINAARFLSGMFAERERLDAERLERRNKRYVIAAVAAVIIVLAILAVAEGWIHV